MSNKSNRLNELASRLRDITEQMDELLEEADDIVREADSLGEEVGSHIHSSFKAYQYAHLKINIVGGDESGYLSRDQGLAQVVEQIEEAARDMKEYEEE